MKIIQHFLWRHWSYIAKERLKRPQEFGLSQGSSHGEKACVFCPGSEHLTPPEIGRIEDGAGGWRMRWFSNKFPAVTPQSEEAYGYQEVIVETPDAQTQLWDFDCQRIASLLSIYQQRVRKLKEDRKITAVIVFKNHGKEAGASIVHSHSQVIATSILPSRIRHLSKTIGQGQQCAVCSFVQEPTKENILLFENEDFIAMTPLAPRMSLEAWIVAKAHRNDFEVFSEQVVANLAAVLQRLLARLKTINISYCFYFISNNENKFHFHIEIVPRTQIWGGFELASGDYIITIPPEGAAQFYQDTKE